MKILNGQQAFAELSAGRIIEARHQQAPEFDSLDNFPATVLVNPEYEFRVKLEMMELAGISFTKPLSLDDVKIGDDVYVVQASGEIHHIFYEHAAMQELIQSIDRGFAQRDVVNAKLQAEAFCKLFDRVYRHNEVVEIKKKRRASKEPVKAAQEVELIEQTSLTNVLIGTDDDLFASFEYQIINAQTPEELKSIRSKFATNGTLSDDQQEQLIELTRTKAEELVPVAETKVEQPSLIDEIDKQASTIVHDSICKAAMSGNSQSSYPVDMLYTQKKKMLINRIQEMDSIEALERLAPAIPAAKLNPEDHQELLQIYAERKTAMQQADA